MSEKGEGEGGKVVEVKKEIVDGPSSPKRVKLGDKNDFKKIARDTLVARFQEQDTYVDYLEEKLGQCSNNGELTSLRESEEKLKLQQQESTRRENVLVMRLATKEQEMQELLTQIHDLKQSQNPAGAQLRSTLLDPAVNIVFQRMKAELDETKEKLEQAQNDLSAWKFTPDSVTGKKLMAKCRMLIQENQELGRQLSQGRVAQLEAELALQKKYSEELKTSQDELNEFVIQLDEEVEGMQSTILTLQKQLKGVKSELVEEKQNGAKQVEQIRILERNLDQARTQPPSPVEGGKTTAETMQCEPDTKELESMETGTEGENHKIPIVHSEPREPGVKKPLAGTPPGPTTFSISQILGQSKMDSSPVAETPIQAFPGGDAVVTKITYMGGYTDPNGEELSLRTEGETVVNGDASRNEDGTQPMVT